MFKDKAGRRNERCKYPDGDTAVLDSTGHKLCKVDRHWMRLDSVRSRRF